MRLAIAAMLALAGCTTATVEMKADGSMTVNFTRFATSAAFDLSPESLSYSSEPSAMAQQNITDALVRALGLAVGSPVALRSRDEPAGAAP